MFSGVTRTEEEKNIVKMRFFISSSFATQGMNDFNLKKQQRMSTKYVLRKGEDLLRNGAF